RENSFINCIIIAFICITFFINVDAVSCCCSKRCDKLKCVGPTYKIGNDLGWSGYDIYA
ncbi:hypothetical protein K492DRAFT_212103, partial [Lichtheimia hyalospora FSU 10163]